MISWAAWNPVVGRIRGPVGRSVFAQPCSTEWPRGRNLNLSILHLIDLFFIFAQICNRKAIWYKISAVKLRYKAAR